MPDDDLLYPPAQYGAAWLLLTFAVVVAAILVGLLVRALTQPRRLNTMPSADPTAVLAQLRAEYQTQIDEVEQQAAVGQLDARRAHAEFSRLMRAFVNEYSGLEAPVLTLQDLVARGAQPELVDALRRFAYPSEFRREAPLDPALGAEAARQVVHTWH
ncbi:MAG: hypothetical protein ABIR17_10800 [Pseudolysinimonas sp.]|uniref:hypothetical protein n=1 Tax=Pseudolysinimonas sp. TaxID=2680009 RepID=UPI003264812F